VDEPDRDWVQEVELLAPAPPRRDEIGFLEYAQVLHDAEARHRQAQLECAERLPVLSEELVEQGPASGIGESLEHRVHGLRL
jgi:hypothetical protein